jgi:hypothetical protein
MPKGYRCSIAIAIVACLQLATGTTQAAETTYTANDLLQDCKDSLLERKVSPRPFYSGLCMGLVAGVNLSFPKIISGHNGGAARTRLG